MIARAVCGSYWQLARACARADRKEAELEIPSGDGMAQTMTLSWPFFLKSIAILTVQLVPR